MSLCATIEAEWKPPDTTLSRFISYCDGSFWPDRCVHYRADCPRVQIRKLQLPVRQWVAIWYLVGKELPEGTEITLSCKDAACINPHHMSINGGPPGQGGLFDRTLTPAKRSRAQAFADYHDERARKLRALIDKDGEGWPASSSSLAPPPLRIHARRTGPSQFAVDGAGQACTAICFVVCFKFIKGNGDIAAVDWTQAVRKGADIWRHWYDNERGPARPGESPSYQGVYHLLQASSSSYALYTIEQTSEFAGTMGLKEVSDTRAYWPLELSVGRMRAIEAAIFVCNRFSIAILLDTEHYWMFDSHGNDADDKRSLLIRFDTLERLIHYLRLRYGSGNCPYTVSTFRRRPFRKLNEAAQKFVRGEGGEGSKEKGLSSSSSDSATPSSSSLLPDDSNSKTTVD